MRKKSLMFALAMLLTIGFGITAEAAEADKTVTLTEKNKIVYSDGADIGSAFQDMAPGDTRTAVIRVQNENSHRAAFYISQETKKSLEETNQASGGAYTYDLKVGKENDDTAVSLLDTIAGGYDASMQADEAGLANITELENYQYFAELDTGDYTNIYLTLSIDGEGFDSTDAVNYQDATGQLAFNFRAYYEDKAPIVVKKTVTEHGETEIITQIVDKVVPLAGAVKTGDSLPVAALSGMLLAGILLVAVALRKRKAEDKS